VVGVLADGKICVASATPGRALLAIVTVECGDVCECSSSRATTYAFTYLPILMRPAAPGLLSLAWWRSETVNGDQSHLANYGAIVQWRLSDTPLWCKQTRQLPKTSLSRGRNVGSSGNFHFRPDACSLTSRRTHKPLWGL